MKTPSVSGGFFTASYRCDVIVGVVMFTLGFSTFPDDDDKGEEERAALKMVRLLQEHGWSFNMSRDPVLILIAIEEDVDEDEEHRDHGDSGDIDEE